MEFKDYIVLVESKEDSSIDDNLKALVKDLIANIKDLDEAKDIAKGIIRYIKTNILKVGRLSSDRLIETKVAEKLKSIFNSKEFEGFEVPKEVEDRIEYSIKGSIPEEEATEKVVKKNKEEFDNDEVIKKERKAKEDEEKVSKKEKEDEEEAKVTDDDIKDFASVKHTEKSKKRIVSDKELEDYLNRKLHRK